VKNILYPSQLNQSSPVSSWLYHHLQDSDFSCGLVQVVNPVDAIYSSFASIWCYIFARTIDSAFVAIDDAWSDEALVVNTHGPAIKFDTACSKDMSSHLSRIVRVIDDHPSNTLITGFNGSTTSASVIGYNAAGKLEYFVPSMPKSTILLCAHAYASDGAAILFRDSGYVYSLSPSQVDDLRHYLNKYTPTITLKVVRSTYEVDSSPDVPDSAAVAFNKTLDPVLFFQTEALNAVASRYFNTVVHVSSVEERILVLLLSGITLRALKLHVEHSSLRHLPSDITMAALLKFERKYGTNPDIIQAVLPNFLGAGHGLHPPPEKPLHVGHMVEADFFYLDLNETIIQSKRTVTQKIKSWGGAIAFFLCIDCYSNYAYGWPVKMVGNADACLRRVSAYYALFKRCIGKFSVDSGLLPLHLHNMKLTNVEELMLYDLKARLSRTAAYTHNRGGARVENAGGALKKLIYFAIRCCISNPNFKNSDFTQSDIFKLWGDLYFWAEDVYNLRPSPSDPTTTKLFQFSGEHADLHATKLLPALCFVLIQRPAKVQGNPLPQNLDFWLQGLYIRPSRETPGNVVVAIKLPDPTNPTIKKLQLVDTGAIKAITSGGYNDIHERLYRTMPSVLREFDFSVDPTPIPTIPTIIEDNIVRPYSPPTLTVAPTSPIPDDSPMPGPLPDDSLHLPSDDISDNAPPPSVSTPTDPALLNRDPLTLSPPPSDLRGAIPLDLVPRLQSLHDTFVNQGSKFRQRDNETRFRSMTDTWASTSPTRLPHRYNTRNAPSANTAVPDDECNEADAIPIPNLSRRARRRIQQDLAVGYSALEICASMCDYASHFLHDDTPPVSGDAPIYSDSSFYDESYMDFYSRHTANYVHANDVEPSSCFFSFEDQAYVVLDDFDPTLSDIYVEESYRAVTENVPRKFSDALKHPLWGEPSRVELNHISNETRSMIVVDSEFAKEQIRQGAQLLRMIPVYEQKEKEGQIVHKVRLVVDGRNHKPSSPTYSATPSREELLVLLQVIASQDWDFYCTDEKRAFLKAPRQDGASVFLRIQGLEEYFKAINAIYGFKTASRDYSDHVHDRMSALGFTRLSLCSCIYTKRHQGQVIFVYTYVDDFLLTGNNLDYLNANLKSLRELFDTTEPLLNANKFLGMEFVRDRPRRLIRISMQQRIQDLCDRFPKACIKKRQVPMPSSGYLVRPSDLETLTAEERRPLTKEEISTYLSIVGSLIWLQGIRFDIIFAVLYLAWNTKAPLQHHLNMAHYCIGYLHHTLDTPLVLGGTNSWPIQLTAYTDASLGTGPNARSITGHILKLHPSSGSIFAKAIATHTVRLSSFESELDGAVTALKTLARISSVLEELGITRDPVSLLYTDNEAMLNFIKGEGVARGCRHMELRMFYARERMSRGDISGLFVAGVENPANWLTKLGNVTQHNDFRVYIQGLALLDSSDAMLAMPMDTADPRSCVCMCMLCSSIH
jgi:Reverse transcriptase (RNA-dependent DNA polymerase)